MNAWQTFRQLQFLARRRVWQSGAGETVFPWPNVRVSAAPTVDQVLSLLNQGPALMLAPGSAEADPEIRGLFKQTVQGRLLVKAEDEMGEVVMVGGPRTGGSGASRGRGLLELEEELLGVFERFNAETGVQLTGGFLSAPDPTYDEEGGGYLLSRPYAFDAWLTSARTYPEPLRLAATVLGGGQVSLAWANPAERFDFHAPVLSGLDGGVVEAARGAMVLRRAAGATAPASATAGTAVALAGAFDAAVVDAPGAGQASYALFAGFDETGSGTSERFSAQETGTTRTVVAT